MPLSDALAALLEAIQEHREHVTDYSEARICDEKLWDLAEVIEWGGDPSDV